MGWTVISMPVCDEVKQNQLQLKSELLDKIINNWYGDNLSFIKELEAKDEKMPTTTIKVRILVYRENSPYF